MAVDQWANPDRGLWGIRGEPQHFVHSKVMCWVAIDRGPATMTSKVRQSAPMPLRLWSFDRGRRALCGARGTANNAAEA